MRTRVPEFLARGSRTVVLTGAGVSAESGVPTFRGAQGLWQGVRPEELATPSAFQQDPERVWAWYAWRRELVGRCHPNPAHRALARLEASLPGLARAHGAHVVEVNPEVTPLTPMTDESHRGTAAEVLPALLEMETHTP